MGQGGQSARCPPLAVTGWQGRQAVRYGSVCSGIEAATVAWHPLGWEAAWYSEIEPFPCAVLKHHYPAVPNYGDMTKYEEWPDEPFDPDVPLVPDAVLAPEVLAAPLVPVLAIGANTLVPVVGTFIGPLRMAM